MLTKCPKTVTTFYSTAVLIEAMVMGIVRDSLGEFRAVFLVLIMIIVVLGLMPIHTIYRNTCGPLDKKENSYKNLGLLYPKT
ncbi:MAG: hypothetical protein QXH73_06590 [Ignisphaera sp.]